MTAREKKLILEAKQDLELALTHLAAGKLSDVELLVTNAKDVLGTMLGETSELES